MKEPIPIGRHLARLTKLYAGAVTKKLEHLDIERYFFVLLAIDAIEVKCTQQYVADKLQMDKVTMVKVIDYLSKHGYINRVQNKDDRREYHLLLTQKAKSTLPLIKKAIDEINTSITKGLTKTQLADFHATLNLIEDNFHLLPIKKINFKLNKV